MGLAIANSEGFLFILRWIHFLSGITWIGVLYYFNFIQGEFFKEVEAPVKGECTQKLVPRALWWFRWGAMITFLSGVFLIMGTLHTGVPLASSWSVLIFIGGFLGFWMWFNVWFVIWPAQKVVIASAVQVAGGGQPIAEAAALGARAGVASRTNTLFSLPMLFFMGAARHLILDRDFSSMSFWPLIISVGITIMVIEVNAIKGKPGPMASVKGVIHCGVLLTAVLYLLVEISTR